MSTPNGESKRNAPTSSLMACFSSLVVTLMLVSAWASCELARCVNCTM